MSLTVVMLVLYRPIGGGKQTALLGWNSAKSRVACIKYFEAILNMIDNCKVLKRGEWQIELRICRIIFSAEEMRENTRFLYAIQDSSMWRFYSRALSNVH
jgi:hypothetical protein